MKTVSEGCAEELMGNDRGERDDGSPGLHNDLFQGKHLTWKEEISARLLSYGRVFLPFVFFQ
jgi:hypothetical protein